MKWRTRPPVDGWWSWVRQVVLPSHQEAATCSEEISAIMGHLQNLPWKSAVRWLLSIGVFICLTDCSLQRWVCEEKTVGLLHCFITLTLMKLYKHIIVKGVAQIKLKQPNIALDPRADLYILRQLPKLWLFHHTLLHREIKSVLNMLNLH